MSEFGPATAVGTKPHRYITFAGSNEGPHINQDMPSSFIHELEHQEQRQRLAITPQTKRSMKYGQLAHPSRLRGGNGPLFLGPDD